MCKSKCPHEDCPIGKEHNETKDTLDLVLKRLDKGAIWFKIILLLSIIKILIEAIK